MRDGNARINLESELAWLRSHRTHVKWLINNFPPYSFPDKLRYPGGVPDLCTHPQIQECRLLGTLLGGTSNRGTVPLIAPPPPEPPPSPSSGSRSSGTWRLLILDTPLPVVASRHQSASSWRPCVARRSDITESRALTSFEGTLDDFTHTRTSYATRPLCSEQHFSESARATSFSILRRYGNLHLQLRIEIAQQLARMPSCNRKNSRDLSAK